MAAASVVVACSTFMLNTGQHLVFGHNLNQNGIDIPGMIFVNKRATFKTERDHQQRPIETVLCEVDFEVRISHF